MKADVDAEPLDAFEEAVRFAIERALKRDREEAAEATPPALTVVDKDPPA